MSAPLRRWRCGVFGCPLSDRSTHGGPRGTLHTDVVVQPTVGEPGALGQTVVTFDANMGEEGIGKQRDGRAGCARTS